MLGGFLSPVSDAYKKDGLASFPHRFALTKLSTSTSTWVSADPWEGLQPQYTRSYFVLSHNIQSVRDCYKVQAAAEAASSAPLGEISMFFLCGGDLFETFYRPGCWTLSLLESIFREFHILVISRAGSKDPREVVAAAAPLTHPSEPGVVLDLSKYADKIVVTEITPNQTSSTLVRNRLKAGQDVAGLVSPPCIAYLQQNKLYM